MVRKGADAPGSPRPLRALVRYEPSRFAPVEAARGAPVSAASRRRRDRNLPETFRRGAIQVSSLTYEPPTEHPPRRATNDRYESAISRRSLANVESRGPRARCMPLWQAPRSSPRTHIAIGRHPRATALRCGAGALNRHRATSKSPASTGRQREAAVQPSRSERSPAPGQRPPPPRSARSRSPVPTPIAGAYQNAPFAVSLFVKRSAIFSSRRTAAPAASPSSRRGSPQGHSQATKLRACGINLMRHRSLL